MTSTGSTNIGKAIDQDKSHLHDDIVSRLGGQTPPASPTRKSPKGSPKGHWHGQGNGQWPGKGQWLSKGAPQGLLKGGKGFGKDNKGKGKGNKGGKWQWQSTSWTPTNPPADKTSKQE